MHITLNGQAKELEPNSTVQDLLDMLELGEVTLVVEVNRKIVDKDGYQTVTLKENDQVELIRFVGGG
jgi:thiamine biosynthesis protein ThiS